MNIGYLLIQAARSFSDRPAVCFGERPVWNYGGFVQRVARLAGGLRALPGIRPGDRIGLAMKNCPQYIEVLYACWHAGLCAVPMNSKLHPREFAFILANNGSRTCFVTADLAEALAPLVAEVDSLQRLICVEDAEYERLAAAEPIDLQPVEDEDPAWLFYTSGTTGRPKGAVLTHRSLRAMTLRYYADVDQLGERDTMIHTAPLSHASGLYSLPHTARASCHVVPDCQGFDSAEVAALLDVYGSVTMFAAPTMLTRMTSHPGMRTARIDNLRTIFYGGAPMYLQDLKRALDVFGPCLWQGYGQGEMPNTITCLSKAMHADSSHPRYEERLTSVGIARTGVELRITDPDGNDLPVGEIGEVVARSDVGMIGYWNNPEATARALRQGWLFTGDVGCLNAEGFLTLKDRSKDLIISGGSNIYPREVEEVLLLHPDVLEVSVIGQRHADWGEEVIAFVVTHERAQVSAAELDAMCIDNIARFKRPKGYVFVDALPKSAYGKILKTELRERLASARDRLERV